MADDFFFFCRHEVTGDCSIYESCALPAPKLVPFSFQELPFSCVRRLAAQPMCRIVFASLLCFPTIKTMLCFLLTAKSSCTFGVHVVKRSCGDLDASGRLVMPMLLAGCEPLLKVSFYVPTEFLLLVNDHCETDS